MDFGFIKLHRTIKRWEWYTDLNVKSVFLHLLLSVNHADAAWQGITIKAGQCVTSYASLSQALGIGEKQVRNAISKLKRTGELVVKATNKYSLVTVVNWALYQSTDPNVADKGASKGQAGDKQRATNKNEKNNQEVYPPEFEVFCSFYPKSLDKQAASRCWLALVEGGHRPDQLIKATKIYAATCSGREPRYIKNATTFLGTKKPFLEYLVADSTNDEGVGPWMN